MSTTKIIFTKATGVYFNFLAVVNPDRLKRDGFLLFCNPFSKKVKPHQKEFLDTGLYQGLDIDGDKVKTYKWGGGSKKILLVHGWTSHSFRWKSYIEYLIQKDFTVYAIDAPAHGLSSGKVLHLPKYERVISEFLKKERGIEYIIGHSFGAFAVTYFLSKTPATAIKKSVIMASNGTVIEFFEYYKNFLALSDRAIGLITQQFERILGRPISSFTATTFSKAVDIPAFIIHDKLDTSTKASDSELLSKTWKNAKLKITEGLGHELKSDELMKEIEVFLSE